MSEDSADLRALAWRLLANEGADGGGASDTADAADKVCQKLRERLTVIIGRGGFSAILEHALKLTRAEFPFLRADLAAQDSPCLKGVQQSVQGQDPSLARSALTILVANFLVSLVSLLGRDLSYTFLRAVWPEIQMD